VTSGTTLEPGTSPHTLSWEGEFEREVTKDLSIRVGYLDTHTYALFVIDQMLDPNGGTGLLALRNSGDSQYRQAQVTVHYTASPRIDLTGSYTWSQGKGDLNTISDSLVPFAAPVIQPDASGLLPSDVPHRVLVTSLMRLPDKFVFSPVADVHTGLPYSDLDVYQNYVGVPDSFRFPTYFSLDIRVYREFSLHAFPFMERVKNRKIRLGFYSTDVTNRRNPHDVYNNVTSPIFGVFAGPEKRIDGVVLDLVP
jgi:hypothetical protein